MIKVKIEEKEYSLPTKWSEVSLKQFKLLTKLEEGDDMTPHRKLIERFKIVVSPELDDALIGQFDVESFYKIVEKMSFITSVPKDKENKVVKIEKQKFGMLQDLKELSVGEWADLEYFIDKSEDNIINEAENILAILVRPLSEESKEYGEYKYTLQKYDSRSLDSRRKYFLEKLNAEQAMSYINFFLSLETEYIKTTLNSLMQSPKMKKMKKLPLTQENIVKIMGG